MEARRAKKKGGGGVDGLSRVQGPREWFGGGRDRESSEGAGADLAEDPSSPPPEGRRPEGQDQARPRTRGGPRAEPTREGTRRERGTLACARAPERRAPVPHLGHGRCRMGRPIAGGREHPFPRPMGATRGPGAQGHSAAVGLSRL